MAGQESLFPELNTADQGASAQAGALRPLGGAVPGGDVARAASEPVLGYVSVVIDIPARALSEPFAYAVPSALDGWKTFWPFKDIQGIVLPSKKTLPK